MWTTESRKCRGVGILLLKCSDFDGNCCKTCHEANTFITVYPWSIYSERHKDKMPDLSMGVRAEICCVQFDRVKAIPRAFWVRKYGEAQSYDEQTIQSLIEATPETYYKILGEAGHQKSQKSAPVYHHTKSTPRPKAKIECPKCGDSWGGIVCENCGYTG